MSVGHNEAVSSDEKLNQKNANRKYVDHRVLDRKEQLKRIRRYWNIKRGQDIFFSSLALIVLSPLMLITAIAIFVDDPHGSPIFSQVRCGRDGKTFKMHKFRSMYVDAEKRLDELMEQNEKDGPAFKIKNDPRITRVGHFIRKTSIDELPQLINILMGDMTIVGAGDIIGTTKKYPYFMGCSVFA